MGAEQSNEQQPAAEEDHDDIMALPPAATAAPPRLAPTAPLHIAPATPRSAAAATLPTERTQFKWQLAAAEERAEQAEARARAAEATLPCTLAPASPTGPRPASTGRNSSTNTNGVIAAAEKVRVGAVHVLAYM